MRFSRRSFVKTTAATLAAAPGILSAQGANDKLNLGWIGGGSRGNYLKERFYVGKNANAQIGYVCDAYDGHVARAIDRVQTMGGNKPKSTKDYRDILADDSIDGVVVATPEHLHHQMTLEALKAGVSLNGMYQTIGAFLGGSYVNDFNRFGRLYKAYIQAEPEYRVSEDRVNLFF